MTNAPAPASRCAASTLPEESGSDPSRCGICRSGEDCGVPFEFAFQPIVDLESGRIFGHEALVRGPQAEPAPTVLSQTNDGNRYNFDQSCRVKAINTACDLGLRERQGELLSINFLPRAVYRPELCIQTTLRTARQRNLDVGQILFEVTEGERIEDGPWFAEILREYRKQGFLTAIDDFGAGYAGLRLLADFQPDVVKIDMDLVRNVDRSPSRQAIARAVIRMAQELHIRIVAEGVETAGERDFFLHEGVSLLQGYLFCRPLFRQLTTFAACTAGGATAASRSAAPSA